MSETRGCAAPGLTHCRALAVGSGADGKSSHSHGDTQSRGQKKNQREKCNPGEPGAVQGLMRSPDFMYLNSKFLAGDTWLLVGAEKPISSY